MTIKISIKVSGRLIKINIWQHKKDKIMDTNSTLRYLQREVCITKNFQQWNSSSTLSPLCISSHDGLYLLKCKLQKILPSISCFCMVFCPNIWIYCIFFFWILDSLPWKRELTCLTWIHVLLEEHSYRTISFKSICILYF